MCEIHVRRIYQQLLNSKCHIYNNKFFSAKRLTDQKILDPIFDLFSVPCISEQLLYMYIIGILNFSDSLALLKDATLKITLRNYSLKKIVTFSGETKTKTEFDKRRRQHRIDICFTDVCYDFDL